MLLSQKKKSKHAASKFALLSVGSEEELQRAKKIIEATVQYLTLHLDVPPSHAHSILHWLSCKMPASLSVCLTPVLVHKQARTSRRQGDSAAQYKFMIAVDDEGPEPGHLLEAATALSRQLPRTAVAPAKLLEKEGVPDNFVSASLLSHRKASHAAAPPPLPNSFVHPMHVAW